MYDYDYDANGNPIQPSAGSSTNVRVKRDISDTKSVEQEDYLVEPNERLQKRVKEINFTCTDKLAGVAYADTANDCSLYHVCLPEAKGKLKDFQMFCNQGLAFDQLKAACMPIGSFDCSKSEKFYAYDKYAKPEKYRRTFVKAKRPKTLKNVKIH